MSFSNHGRFRQQVRFLRRQFLQDGELPFTDVLSESAVAQALTALSVVWLDRVYSPLVTLWIFLAQVLSQDHSCRAGTALSQEPSASRAQIQTLEAFQPLIAAQGDCSWSRRSLYDRLLAAVVTHRVADRPDRFEPRQRKRRQKKYDRMMKPRNQLKRAMLKRLR